VPGAFYVLVGGVGVNLGEQGGQTFGGGGVVLHFEEEEGLCGGLASVLRKVDKVD